MTVGMDHVGISVSNLVRSVEFYCTGFGMTVLEQETFGGRQYEAILALKGASGRVSVLRREGLQIELFEFDTPPARTMDPRRPVCDHGITHFCVRVDGIDDCYERLKAAGAVFHCPPLTFDPLLRATYGRDPDGNVFELLEVGALVPKR
jgi:glyoxylase I family protein